MVTIHDQKLDRLIVYNFYPLPQTQHRVYKVGYSPPVTSNGPMGYRMIPYSVPEYDTNEKFGTIFHTEDPITRNMFIYIPYSVTSTGWPCVELPN